MGSFWLVAFVDCDAALVPTKWNTSEARDDGTYGLEFVSLTESMGYTLFRKSGDPGWARSVKRGPLSWIYHVPDRLKHRAGQVFPCQQPCFP